MAAYLTFTIIGSRSKKRDGTKEVQITVRAISMPDLPTATWLLREKYPSANVISIAVNAAHDYNPITAAGLATTPVRRHKRRAS